MSQNFNFKEYPTFEVNAVMQTKNFQKIFEKFNRGEPIVSNEEQRILCKFFSYAETGADEDNKMCQIDKGLADGM